MKKVIASILFVVMLVALSACGNEPSAPSAAQQATSDGNSGGDFMAGFGVVNITPREFVAMSGYGDHETRRSTGFSTYLEARCLALVDQNGEKLLLFTADISFAYPNVCEQLLLKLEKELDIPADHVVISGTHTHNSVATWVTSDPGVVSFNRQFVDGMLEAATIALADCKKAEVYIGSVQTEGLNFVRRYYMDDGSLAGDGTYGTGTTYVSHESEADGQMQLMKFVREGGKDILVANFQAHPHLEGKSNSLSAQIPGVFRTYMEKSRDIHCLYWNGAGGNLNSTSRIESEIRTKDREEYAKLLGDYALSVYDSLQKVATGPIRVAATDFAGRVNHSEHHKVADAQKVEAYFKECNNTDDATKYAWQFDINSLNHARRIISNSKLGETKDLRLFAFSFGDVSGIVAEYEMFDTNGMQIKEATPFDITFILGYSYPATQGYVASALGYENGGYEVDNGTYVPGTGEELVAAYLALLEQIH